MLCDDVVMLCGDFMLFLDIDNGRTDGLTDERTFVLLESLSRLKSEILGQKQTHGKPMTNDGQ